MKRCKILPRNSVKIEADEIVKEHLYGAGGQAKGIEKFA